MTPPLRFISLVLLLAACAPRAVVPARPFHATIEPLDAATVAHMREIGVLKDDCPVGPGQLVRLRFVHHTPAGSDAEGVLVVHQLAAPSLADVLRQLYEAGFVIASARPIEEFGGSDDRSMEANNTSAFNCRAKTPSRLPDGTLAPTEYSVHSYGAAIDVNPAVNPYIKPKEIAGWQSWRAKQPPDSLPHLLFRFCSEGGACTILPPAGANQLAHPEPKAEGIRNSDAVIDVFRKHGWHWGGEWPANEQDKVRSDLQHFELELPRQ